MLQDNVKRELLVNKVASICMISCTNVTATRATIYTVTDITASVGGKGVLPLNFVSRALCLQIWNMTCRSAQRLVLICPFSTNLSSFADSKFKF